MQMKLLAIAGDPGGARALLVVLKTVQNRQIPFVIIDHGFLGNEAPIDWARICPDSIGVQDQFNRLFESREYFALIFASSVADNLPLRLARIARHFGVPVIHLLDHWGNYSRRLESDGESILVPDVYAVMDDLAFSEAIHEGLPKNVLRITGHPTLSTIIDDLNKFEIIPKRKRLETIGISNNKPLIVFVSEPVELDSASGHPAMLGQKYNEKSVLQDICIWLQPYANDIQFAIVPHPREDFKILTDTWQNCSGKLQGSVIKFTTGREAIFSADGVIGMSSVLLYEAWLIGRPVLSVHPGLSISNSLKILQREDIFHLADLERGNQVVTAFIDEVQNRSRRVYINPELELHANAPENVCKCIEAFLK